MTLLTWREAVEAQAISVSASRREKAEHYEIILTLANNKVSSNRRCEVNMSRK